MKNGEYSIALLTFFVGYVIFEAASGLLLKYFRPSRFIPAIILVWGTICIGMGFVTNVSPHSAEAVELAMLVTRFSDLTLTIRFIVCPTRRIASIPGIG